MSQQKTKNKMCRTENFRKTEMLEEYAMGVMLEALKATLNWYFFDMMAHISCPVCAVRSELYGSMQGFL